MSGLKCPICGSSNCIVRVDFFYPTRYFIYCRKINNEFFVDGSIVFLSDVQIRYRLLNLIVEHLYYNYPNQTRFQLPRPYYFVGNNLSNQLLSFSDQVDLSQHLESYPNTTMERVLRIIVNISKFYGSDFKVDFKPHHLRVFFCESPDDQVAELKNIFKKLRELQFVVKKKGADSWTLTEKAYKRIDKLKNTLQTDIDNIQCFIAISYSPEATEILEIIKSAVDESGYTPVIIEEKEHNNDIIPEMLLEIECSKFMVVDVSFPNFGAYYEAGYAQALGKPVIFCCNRRNLNSPIKEERPHFDIAQKPLVVWNDYDELKSKLILRIRSTITSSKTAEI